ncbi:putative sulfate exporter family transporter [Pyrobaculum aerophilum]|uniref:putative sulfate exporter family transporter n=1 Tax=Pyrobaculum aerophilum TaxID=13773 RepID=UPI0023EFCD92|nr:putative sulfate exporter family transporter [Pyrobaculum aerophilum]MCX8135650.1 YeiH family protein [Pyrobaculum aerophilum]
MAWTIYIPTLWFLLLGWVPKTSVWIDPAKSISTASTGYAYLGGWSLLLLYFFTLVVLSIAAWIMKYNVKAYAVGYTVIFWLSYLMWWLGHYAYVAATPDQWKNFGISWGLSLTGEAGYIFALVLGLLIGNVFRKLPKPLEVAARPEWYIKTAIVLLGAVVGAKSLQNLQVASEILTRSLIAIVAAYLIYWPIAYVISRKVGLDRTWSAVLASGVSICGVSAAIATAGAIGAPAIIPGTIASIVVIFAVIELIILPWVAAQILTWAPLAAGAWMGLSVKTDGAAAASGAVVDALISAKIPEAKGWLLSTAVTTKVFIDIWIGIWAFILAVWWVTRVERRPGERVSPMVIWFRFPKFVIGYFVTIFAILALASFMPLKDAISLAGAITGQSDVLRQFFFLITFMSIGLTTNFRTFKEIGAGKAVVAYLISLLIIIVIALGLSIAFFADVPLPES